MEASLKKRKMGADREREGERGRDGRRRQNGPKELMFREGRSSSLQRACSYDVHNFPCPFSLTEFKQSLFSFLLLNSDVIDASFDLASELLLCSFVLHPYSLPRRRWLRIPIFGSLARFKALGNYCLRWPRWLLLPCCAACVANVLPIPVVARQVPLDLPLRLSPSRI